MAAVTQAAAGQTTTSNDVNALRKEIVDLRGALLKVTSDVQAFHDRHLSKHKTKTEERSRWFPWVVISLVVNVLLWLSLLYVVFRLADYDNDRGAYLSDVWPIFCIPLVVMVYLSFSPWPAALRALRSGLATTTLELLTTPAINLLNAALCFVFVVVYIYTSAIPSYNRGRWAVDISSRENMPWPSVWLYYADIAGAEFIDLTLHDFSCSVWTGSLVSSCVPSVSFGGGFTVVNSSQVEAAPILKPQEPSAFLAISFMVSYNSSSSQFPAGGLSISALLLDRRITVDQRLCSGFSAPVQFSCFGETKFYLQAEGEADTFGLTAQRGAPPNCGSISSLISDPDPLLYYTVLTQYLAPSPTNLETSVCNVATNPDAWTHPGCSTSISISFGNFMLSTSISEPGISKLDIFLNLGAIVGAVQFFVWFLTIFNY